MKIILHICCGICAIPVITTLVNEDHSITGFFYNPNIHPREEYEKRLSVTQKVCREFNVPLEIAAYEPDIWLQKTASLKNEPEGGARCQLCFQIRLNKTYQYLLKSGAASFTTTLTVSRHKSTETINRIGQEIKSDKFLVRDFKKDNHPEKTLHLIRQWGLYTQKYCGCIYSLQESNLRNQKKKSINTTT